MRSQRDSSANGSVTGSRRRFASSYLTTSGCGTTFAGRCLLLSARRDASRTGDVRICRCPCCAANAMRLPCRDCADPSMHVAWPASIAGRRESMMSTVCDTDGIGFCHV